MEIQYMLHLREKKVNALLNGTGLAISCQSIIFSIRQGSHRVLSNLKWKAHHQGVYCLNNAVRENLKKSHTHCNLWKTESMAGIICPDGGDYRLYEVWAEDIGTWLIAKYL